MCASRKKHIAGNCDDLGQSLTALTMELAELETRLPPTTPNCAAGWKPSVT